MEFSPLVDFAFDEEELEWLLLVAKIPKTVLVLSQHMGRILLVVYCDISCMVRIVQRYALFKDISKVVVRDNA